MFQLAETKSETRLRFQTAPHPVLTIVGQLWRAAADEGRPPRLEDISLADIRKTCATMTKKHPDKPSVFFAKDLSRLAYALPRTDHWWLPPPNVGGRLLDLSKKTRRKDPKALMDVDSPSHRALLPLPRSLKRPAASVAQAEEQADKDNDEKSKTGPQKPGTAVSRRVVQVVIQSPKNRLPASLKRRRVEENVESQKSDSEERKKEKSAEPWVGKGQDRCKRCRKLNLPACEPQWQEKRPFSSCKACSRVKTACEPTKIWKEKVAVYNQALHWFGKPSRAGIEAASERHQGRRLKTTDTAPPAVATNPQPTPSQAETAIDPRIQVIDQRTKEEISDLKACMEGHSAGLATLERTQQELRNMLLMLCGHQAITVASAAPSASTSSALSPVVGFSDPRVGEGSVPARAQSSTGTTSKARGQTRPPAASRAKTQLSSKSKGRA